MASAGSGWKESHCSISRSRSTYVFPLAGRVGPLAAEVRKNMQPRKRLVFFVGLGRKVGLCRFTEPVRHIPAQGGGVCRDRTFAGHTLQLYSTSRGLLTTDTGEQRADALIAALLAAYLRRAGAHGPREYHWARIPSPFAAYDLASGSVIAQHYRRHHHQEFLRFLELIDSAVPRDLEPHLVLEQVGRLLPANLRLSAVTGIQARSGTIGLAGSLAELGSESLRLVEPRSTSAASVRCVAAIESRFWAGFRITSCGEPRSPRDTAAAYDPGAR